MSKFILPDYKGIHEAIADVRQFGKENGVEKIIGLKRDGRRLFEAVGGTHNVVCPDGYDGQCGDVFLIHCHPNIPTPLSLDDLTCIQGMRADGNMAVAVEDETISWSHGLIRDVDPVSYWMLGELAGRCISLYLKGASDELSETDDRCVAVSDLFLWHLQKAGCLKDLHTQYGEKARAILAKYEQGERGGYMKTALGTYSSRKIEQEMCAAIAQKRDFLKDNTTVTMRGPLVGQPDRCEIHLFGNRIAVWHYSGDAGAEVDVTSLRRWPTNTTLSRLRALGVDIRREAWKLVMDGKEL